jgi:ubiquinone/menaquinone biosynthesis C-methylase UbiE
MILELFVSLSERLPVFRRWAWKRWYQHLAGYAVADWSFMNYGFELLENHPRLELAPADEDDRYCIQLYHHVASAIPLADQKVLEVGSGRGGGASFVKRYLQPKTMTGVDFSAKAVTFCQQRHVVDGLLFRQGDAEALPFEDASFDVVLNVESSHCYGSMPAFLQQVVRVLQPGGHFLFTDFRTVADIAVLQEQLLQCGLTMVSETTITPNVLRALEADSERKQKLIGRNIHGWLTRIFQQFAGVKGSKVYDCFRDGSFVYKSYVLRK